MVQQEDGTFKSSPFYIRFGKKALITAKDLTVDIEINGQQVDLHMKLGETGDAYFVGESESLSSENKSSSTESVHEEKTPPKPVESTSDPEPSPTITVTDTGHPRSESIPVKSPQKQDNLLNGTKSSPKYNFFSDGEITPDMTSPAVSRPASPKSDSEADLIKVAIFRALVNSQFGPNRFVKRPALN